MRTLRELLTIVKSTLSKEDTPWICRNAAQLYERKAITQEEYLRVRQFLTKELPPRTYDWNGEVSELGPLSWPHDDLQSRMDWLQSHINRLPTMPTFNLEIAILPKKYGGYPVVSAYALDKLRGQLDDPDQFSEILGHVWVTFIENVAYYDCRDIQNALARYLLAKTEMVS